MLPSCYFWNLFDSPFIPDPGFWKETNWLIPILPKPAEFKRSLSILKCEKKEINSKYSAMRDFHSICSKCGGQCCIEARPPISKKRLQILKEAGISEDCFEFRDYIYPKVNENGFCIFFDEKEKKCKVHAIKPETCVAGPFTFDIKNKKLEIYIKREKICPLVSILKQDKEAYEEQFRKAVRKILDLTKNLEDKELKKILEIEEEEVDRVAELELTQDF